MKLVSLAGKLKFYYGNEITDWLYYAIKVLIQKSII